MKTLKKYLSGRIVKWLLLLALVLFSQCFGTTARAAAPNPLKKSGLPLVTYPCTRLITVYADYSLTQSPVRMTGDYLKLKVTKRKSNAFYVTYKDVEGWVAVDSLMADASYREADVTLKKALKGYIRAKGRYLGKIPKKSEVCVVARQDGWVQLTYKYNGKNCMCWALEKAYEASIPRKYRRQTDGADETAADQVNSAGNCDDFIGLSDNYWVLATAKKKTYVYAKESLDSTVMGHFTKNNCIVVDTKEMEKGTDYTWLKVKMTNGKTGYIPFSYVTLDVLNVKNFGLTTDSAENKQRIEICQYGLPYIGTRFVLGGSSLTSGIDCSTFARRAMRNAGVMVSSYALAVDLSNSGEAIKRSQLKPGDMVFYYNSWSDQHIGHCAIYVGNGFIINASGHQGSVYPSGGMRFSKIDYRSPTAVKFRNLVGN